MDTFFTQKHCDRCERELKATRMMSMYNTDCLCMSCKKKETKRPDYDEAVTADHEEIKKGNYKFKEIKR